MASDRPSWSEIDKKRDRARGSRPKKIKKSELDESSSRYSRYKADLDRLFDLGLAGDLLNKPKAAEKEAPKEKKSKKAEAKQAKSVPKRNGRIPVNRQPSTNRLKLLRTIIDAGDAATLNAAIDELVQNFGIPDDLEVLVRVLEHPAEELVAKAVLRLAELLPQATKVPRRATLKERLRSVSQTAHSSELREQAAALESSL